jgi:hypothetical protein
MYKKIQLYQKKKTQEPNWKLMKSHNDFLIFLEAACAKWTIKMPHGLVFCVI